MKAVHLHRMSQLFLCAVWRGGSSTAPSKVTFFAFSRRFSCFLSYDNESACWKLSAHILTSSNTGFHPRTIRTGMIHEAGLLVKCTAAFDEHLTELKLAHNFYFGIFEAKPVKTIARYINFRWNKCPGHRWEKCLLLYSTMFGSIGLAVGLLASAAFAKILYAGVNEVRFDTQARFPECAFMNSSPPSKSGGEFGVYSATATKGTGLPGEFGVTYAFINKVWYTQQKRRESICLPM